MKQQQQRLAVAAPAVQLKLAVLHQLLPMTVHTGCSAVTASSRSSKRQRHVQQQHHQQHQRGRLRLMQAGLLLQQLAPLLQLVTMHTGCCEVG